jgi:hypothetical protein
MARYIVEKIEKIEKTQKKPIQKILYLSGDISPDYLRCVTLHGFKTIFGNECHDFPKINHIYKINGMDYSTLYGKGITYTKLLDEYYHKDEYDISIEEDIKNKNYDVVIYGSYHRGMPYYELVCKSYKSEEIVLLCGEDTHTCDYSTFTKKGHPVFVRELIKTDIKVDRSKKNIMSFIEYKFTKLCKTPSDINEHLPTLSKYASKCESVFETGVRGCISSWAFANGLLENQSSKKLLFMNDITPCNIDELMMANRSMNSPIEISYEWKNNLDLSLNQCYDLTFIDTWHVYGQLKRELAKFAAITNKYIIMHDTIVDEWEGETIRVGWNAEQQSLESGFPVNEITCGLWPAIQEFLISTEEWVLHERFTNNNGLTILARR